MVLLNSSTAQQLDDVDAAELASGVELTVDFTDVVGGVVTVTGVDDAVTERFIVTGSSLTSVNGATGAGRIDYDAALTLTNVLFDYRGGAGADFVIGTSAADVISGGFGDDELATGGGADTLSGGDGADVFAVTGFGDVSSTIVVVSDYEATEVAASYE